MFPTTNIQIFAPQSQGYRSRVCAYSIFLCAITIQFFTNITKPLVLRTHTICGNHMSDDDDEAYLEQVLRGRFREGAAHSPETSPVKQPPPAPPVAKQPTPKAAPTTTVLQPPIPATSPKESSPPATTAVTQREEQQSKQVAAAAPKLAAPKGEESPKPHRPSMIGKEQPKPPLTTTVVRKSTAPGSDDDEDDALLEAVLQGKNKPPFPTPQVTTPPVPHRKVDTAASSDAARAIPQVAQPQAEARGEQHRVPQEEEVANFDSSSPQPPDPKAEEPSPRTPSQEQPRLAQDDDEDATLELEATILLNSLLKTNDDEAEKAEDENSRRVDEAMRKTQGGATATASSEAPSDRTVLRALLEEHDHSSDVSLTNEEEVLKAILNALDEQPQSGAQELMSDTSDVEEVLAHAQRIAASGVSNRALGQSVLHTHENHAIREELRIARTTLGWPSCLAVSPDVRSTLIIVGTSMGLIAIFGPRAKITGVCGAINTSGESRGAVVSLSVATGEQSIAAGYERGCVVVWDAETLEPLKAISGDFAQPVFRTHFLHPDPLKLICADGANTVKLFSLAKLMGKTMARSVSVETHFDTILSDVATTFLTRTAPNGDLLQENYIALISAEAFTVSRAVFGLQNDVDEVFRAPCTAENGPGSNQLLLWQERGKSPILAVCWGNRVDIWNLVVSNQGEVSIMCSNTVKLPLPLHTMSRLSGSCILLCDEEDTLHLVDLAAATLVESMRLFGLDPVQFSHRSCGIKYHGGASAGGGISHLLGKMRLFSCSVLSWDSRLDALVEMKAWKQALELAKGFALEVAVAVVGLSENPTIRRKTVQAYIEQLLINLIADTIRKAPGQVAVKALIFEVMTFCAEIETLDVLFGPVLTFFQNLDLKDVFLETLELLLLQNTIVHIPDHIIAAFIELYSSPERMKKLEISTTTNDAQAANGQTANTEQETDAVLAWREALEKASSQQHKLTSMERAEAALMHVVDSNDLILEVAQEYHLWKLVSCVWCVRKRQPESVIIELTGVADAALVTFVLGILDGRSPIGEPLSPVALVDFKRRVLAALVQHPSALSQLLHASPEDMYEAFAKALHTNTLWNEDFPKGRFVEVLKGVLIDETVDFRKPWILDKKDGSFPALSLRIRFMKTWAELIANGEALSSVSKDRLHQTVHRIAFATAYFCSKCADRSTIEERRELQQGLANFLTSAPLKSISIEHEIEPELVKARLARVVATLRGNQNRFSEALEVFLDEENNAVDPELRGDVFAFLRGYATTKDENVIQPLKAAVKTFFTGLVTTDATQLAHFIFDFMHEFQHEAMRCLGRSRFAQFRYLREMLEASPDLRADVEMQDRFIELLCEFEPSAVYTYLVEHNQGLQYDIDLAQEHCKMHNITDARIFLYEKTLQIGEAMQLLMDTLLDRMVVARRTIIDRCLKEGATITGNPLGTSATGGGLLDMQVSFSDMAQQSTILAEQILVHNNTGALRSIIPNDDAEAEVLKMVEVGVELCKRYQQHLDHNELSKIWFSLLDAFAKPKKLLLLRMVRSQELRQLGRAQPKEPLLEVDFEDELAIVNDERVRPSFLQIPLSVSGERFVQEMQLFYSRYVSFVLSHMVLVLELQTVVSKIVVDNESERFGPFKPIIVSILESLRFDLEANSLCKLCTEADVYRLSDELRRSFASGVLPRSEFCWLCRKFLSERIQEFETLRFFRCGHGYHDACIGSQGDCPQCTTEKRFGPEAVIQVPKATTQQDKQRTTTTAVRDATTEPFDIARACRMMKHTRAKLDGSRNYMEALQKMLHGDKSSVKRGNRVHLILAPAPCLAQTRPPIPGQLKNLNTADIKECFTEEEFLTIFGPNGRYIPPPKRVPIAENKGGGHHGGGGGDGLDFEDRVEQEDVEDDGDDLDW